MSRPFCAPCRPARTLLALAAGVLVAACAQTGPASRAPWPALVPLEQILTEAPPPADPTTALQGRAAALRVRADRLRQPVIAPGDLPPA